jgi:hypothetical protein
MTTFYVYSNDDVFITEIRAVSEQTARQLAAEVVDGPHKVLSFRLTFNLQLAA